jgi:DNA-binding NtrC family response regulator
MNAAIPLHVAGTRPCVVFVDDDAGNRQAFKTAFRHAMNVYTASNIQEVWQHLAAEDIHVVIADQRMPGTKGSELLAQVRERYPAVRRMLVTAYADLEAIIEAVNNGGVSKYFAKPWANEQVVQAVKQAHEEVLAEVERTEYTRKLEEANRQLEFALRQRLLS